MKTDEFNKNYEIETKTKRGLRATPKTVAALPKPEVLTADGEIFDSSKTYFFFDTSTRQIRQSTGLRQCETEYLGSFGLRVVEIVKLRSDKDSALSDGQEFLKNRIAALNQEIADFELEKSSQNRDLKSFLIARDAAK